MPFDDRYPILTEDISSELPGSGGSSTTTNPGGDFQRTVQDTLRNVLGIRVATADASTVSKALANAFTIVDANGVQSYVLNQTSLSIDASNGDVTGLQKVLMLEAQDVVKTCAPLIMGLQPIGMFNPEDVEPLRGLTVQALQDLGQEFAYAGGLRPQILDTLFLNLLGQNPVKPGESVNWAGGYFASLQGVMNLYKTQIRFTDDERIYTDFLTAAHMTYNLFHTWNVNRAEFSSPDKDRYLGELQYLLSRALDVVREKRNMLVVIANSVFVNPSDLSNFYLRLPDGELTVGEILDAIDNAVAKTPGMLKQGGLWAVTPIGETLHKLEKLIGQTIEHVNNDPDVPSGCKTDRFKSALIELHKALDIATKRVDTFPKNRMTLTSATFR